MCLLCHWWVKHAICNVVTESVSALPYFFLFTIGSQTRLLCHISVFYIIDSENISFGGKNHPKTATSKFTSMAYTNHLAAPAIRTISKFVVQSELYSMSHVWSSINSILAYKVYKYTRIKPNSKRLKIPMFWWLNIWAHFRYISYPMCCRINWIPDKKNVGSDTASMFFFLFVFVKA